MTVTRLEVSDQDLVAAVRDGNDAAFDELYALPASDHRLRARNVARRRAGGGRDPGGLPVGPAPDPRDRRRTRLSTLDLPDRPERGNRLHRRSSRAVEVSMDTEAGLPRSDQRRMTGGALPESTLIAKAPRSSAQRLRRAARRAGARARDARRRRALLPRDRRAPRHASHRGGADAGGRPAAPRERVRAALGGPALHLDSHGNRAARGWRGGARRRVPAGPQSAAAPAGVSRARLGSSRSLTPHCARSSPRCCRCPGASARAGVVPARWAAWPPNGRPRW